MPKILESAVKDIMAKHHTKSQAYAIATAALKKSGILGSNGQLTPKGKVRNAMTKAQRAKTRKK
jgi:hypothetical protein